MTKFFLFGGHRNSKPIPYYWKKLKNNNSQTQTHTFTFLLIKFARKILFNSSTTSRFKQPFTNISQTTLTEELKNWKTKNWIRLNWIIFAECVFLFLSLIVLFRSFIRLMVIVFELNWKYLKSRRVATSREQREPNNNNRKFSLSLFYFSLYWVVT